MKNLLWGVLHTFMKKMEGNLSGQCYENLLKRRLRITESRALKQWASPFLDGAGFAVWPTQWVDHTASNGRVIHYWIGQNSEGNGRDWRKPLKRISLWPRLKRYYNEIPLGVLLMFSSVPPSEYLDLQWNNSILLHPLKFIILYCAVIWPCIYKRKDC